MASSLQDARYDAFWVIKNWSKVLPIGWIEVKVSELSYEPPQWREIGSNFVFRNTNSHATIWDENQLARVLENQCQCFGVSVCVFYVLVLAKG